MLHFVHNSFFFSFCFCIILYNHMFCQMNCAKNTLPQLKENENAYWKTQEYTKKFQLINESEIFTHCCTQKLSCSKKPISVWNLVVLPRHKMKSTVTEYCIKVDNPEQDLFFMHELKLSRMGPTEFKWNPKTHQYDTYKVSIYSVISTNVRSFQQNLIKHQSQLKHIL